MAPLCSAFMRTRTAGPRRHRWVVALAVLALCAGCAPGSARSKPASAAGSATGSSAGAAGSAAGPGPAPHPSSAPTSGTPAGSPPVDPPLPPIATVGPLFSGAISHGHFCTASVLDAPGQNLIITAAHCLAGSGAGLLFAPGYHDGVAPYGVWTVQRAFADPAWLSGQDEGHDYAILQLAAQQWAGRTVGIEAVTGGNTLGPAPADGQAVTVIAYNAGEEEPVHCAVVVRHQGSYPAFDCDGFFGGTSGGPWLATSTGSASLVVTAVIGGPNYGGCDETTSYSSVFDTSVFTLFSQAIASQSPAVFPVPRGDGC